MGGKHLRAPFVKCPASEGAPGSDSDSTDRDLATNCCRMLEQYPTDGHALFALFCALICGRKSMGAALASAAMFARLVVVEVSVCVLEDP